MPDDRSVLTRTAPSPDQTIAYGKHADQVADIRFAHASPRERPLAMLLHGGFWRPTYDRTHTAPMAAAIASAGWTVATVEYRRIPGDPDATLQDVKDALTQLPARVARHGAGVVLIGHSAGGHLALWAGVECRAASLSGVLALAPVADLELAYARALDDDAVGDFLGERRGARADVDPARMASPQVKTTIVHGEDDAIVPIALSESYASKHPATRLVRIPGAGHFAVIDPLSPAWPRILEELGRIAR